RTQQEDDMNNDNDVAPLNPDERSARPGRDADIARLAGRYRGRNRAVAFDRLVFSVATAQDTSAGVGGQTEQTLAALERNLIDAGSEKRNILSATVYITDIEKKAEMDAVWDAWIGTDHWPQRACVQAALAGDTLVEITCIAARD
ncbi:MAG: RidA family protein, partial [Gammaproteobacteria bacterium]